MKIKKLLTYSVLLSSLFLSAQNYDIAINYVNLEHGEANPIKTFKTIIDSNVNVPQKDFVVLVPTVEFQEIEGIGGAFNENGGEALLSLSKANQNKIIENLFSKDKADFSFNRTPIGASDFSLDSYSYSMVAEDYEMRNFSINRDKKYLLPFIKSALQENPEMLIQASPWSPPAWMKVNNAVDKNDEIKGKSGLKDNPEIYNAYAKYLVKYIEAYKEEGVIIDRFCVQNEPDTYAPFPGCNIPINQYQNLSLNYVIPAFREAKLNTGIWSGTFRTIDRGDHYKILNSTANKAFDGIGFQYAEEPFMREVKLLVPNMKMMHTEGVCFNGDNSAEQAKTRLAEIASYINAGTTNYCYWNIILNETSKSAWGWKQNSLLVINRETKEVTYTPDYNALYLVSNAIKKNDKRIAHIASQKIITVTDAKGIIKVVIQNNEANNKFVRLFIDEKEINVKIPANALSTIKLKPEL